MYTVTEEKLAQDDQLVQQVTTLNQGGSFKARRRFLVLHYTAGPSLEGTLGQFTDPLKKVSAHLVIGRDAKVVQVVPFNRIAWHAGESSWKPASGSAVKGLNAYALGIEMVNAGPLTRAVDGTFYTWYGAKVVPEDVIEVDPAAPGSFHKRWWHRFPGEQVQACLEIAGALVNEIGLEEILGHSDIAPLRKTDPGPAFPMSHIRSIVFGRA